MDDILVINHFYLNISIPLGGQDALGFTLFNTIDVDSPFDTITEKGWSIFLNWFLSLYPDSFTCLYITQLFTLDRFQSKYDKDNFFSF